MAGGTILVGILALGLTRPRVWRSGGGPEDTALMQMKGISDAVDMHVYDRGAVPAALEELTRPSARTGVPFLDAIPLDPWGHAYQYRVVDAARRLIHIRSAGADGRFDTDDDVTWPTPARDR